MRGDPREILALHGAREHHETTTGIRDRGSPRYQRSGGMFECRIRRQGGEGRAPDLRSLHSDTHTHKAVKSEYEVANTSVTVKLVPIATSENDYYTKLTLMNRSASTAPDVPDEDTFLIKSDAEAGYLAPPTRTWRSGKTGASFPTTPRRPAKVWTTSSTASPWAPTRGRSGTKRRIGESRRHGAVGAEDLERPTRRRQKNKAAEPGVVPLNVYSEKAAG